VVKPAAFQGFDQLTKPLQEEIPEAFAPHRGQFEVHRPAAKPLPAVVTPEEEFFGWMREAMEKHLEASA